MPQDIRQRRAAPSQGMPRTAPVPSRDALRGKPKPVNELPKQRSLTEEEAPLPPAKWKKILARVLSVLLIAVSLAAGYIFLLLGEPDEEAKLTAAPPEESITMPMPAIETAGETNLQSVSDAFGEPILALYNSGLQMQKSRVYDTAFSGGYARRATLIYLLPDGSQLSVESIRPTAAAALLSADGNKLDSGSLYTLGGINAALMRNAESVCVFGQSDTAVYAVICGPGHDEQLKTLIKQTTLVAPSADAR